MSEAIGNLKDSTPLTYFFHSINFRKDRVSATTATARKLAVIIWNMVVKNVQYKNWPYNKKGFTTYEIRIENWKPINLSLSA